MGSSFIAVDQVESTRLVSFSPVIFVVQMRGSIKMVGHSAEYGSKNEVEKKET